MKRWALPRRHGEHRAEMFEEQASGVRGYTWGWGRRKGRNGDTVSRTLGIDYRIRYYLSSEKLKTVD